MNTLIVPTLKACMLTLKACMHTCSRIAALCTVYAHVVTLYFRADKLQQLFYVKLLFNIVTIEVYIILHSSMVYIMLILRSITNLNV